MNFPHVSSNTEFDCCGQKYTPVYNILSQLNSIHTFTAVALDVVWCLSVPKSSTATAKAAPNKIKIFHQQIGLKLGK